MRRRLKRILALDARYVGYWLWIRWRGFDFSGPPSAAPSGGPDLARVLDRLSIPAGCHVLDVGCGAGAAMITLSRYFDAVSGVERDPELAERARRNLLLAGVQATVWTQDALTLTLDAYGCVYLFNPIPAEARRALMARLAESLARAPRQLVLIYKFPGPAPDEVPRDLFGEPIVCRSPHTHPIYVWAYHPK